MTSSPRRRTQRGMTLIELLLAVTLFAAIAGSIGIVLNVAFGSLDRITTRIDFTRRVLSSQRTLDQIVNGLIPVNAPCVGRPFAFVGFPNGARFVTSHSLTEGSRGRLQVVDLLVDRSPNGGYRLVLNEQPFFGRRAVSVACATPMEVRPTSFILADRLAFVRFAYRRIDPQMHTELWVPQWNFPEWPSGLRIEMAPDKWQPNQILPVTLNAAIFVKNNNFDESIF